MSDPQETKKHCSPRCPKCEDEAIVSMRRKVEGYIVVYCISCGHIIGVVPDMLR